MHSWSFFGSQPVVNVSCVHWTGNEFPVPTRKPLTDASSDCKSRSQRVLSLWRTLRSYISCYRQKFSKTCDDCHHFCYKVTSMFFWSPELMRISFRKYINSNYTRSTSRIKTLYSRTTDLRYILPLSNCSLSTTSGFDCSQMTAGPPQRPNPTFNVILGFMAGTNNSIYDGFLASSMYVLLSLCVTRVRNIKQFR